MRRAGHGRAGRRFEEVIGWTIAQTASRIASGFVHFCMRWLEVLVALVTVFAGVAGVLQLVVVLLDRRRRNSSTISPAGTVSPEWHARTRTPPPTPRTGGVASHKTADEVGRYEPLWGEQPPIDPERVGVAWRASLAYLLGWIGGVLFRRDHRSEVRFHAAQSLLIDAAAVLYAAMACICLIPYLAVRYPQGNEIDSSDPAMWSWTATVLFVPPLLHIVLAIVALLGFRPKIPIIWRIAATISARRR